MQVRQRMQPQPWIKTRVKHLGKTLSGLGKAMGGLDSSRITEIMAGTRRVHAEEVRPMAAYLELPYEDVYSRLFGGVPSLAGEVRTFRAAQPEQEADQRIHPVRELAGGIVELSADTADIPFNTNDLTPRPFNCYVKTPHMVPAYEEGDDLRINPALPVAAGNDVLLVAPRIGGEPARAMLRRLVEKTDNFWVVKQHNPPKTEKIDRKVWIALRVESVKRRG